MEAAPRPQVEGWDDIGTGGETGVRCPSLRWAAGQGPVLVGTIGSLWTSCGAGEGWGCWTIEMLRLSGTPKERGYQDLLGKVDAGKGQDHKRQIQRSSSNQGP